MIHTAGFLCSILLAASEASERCGPVCILNTKTLDTIKTRGGGGGAPWSWYGIGRDGAAELC